MQKFSSLLQKTENYFFFLTASEILKFQYFLHSLGLKTLCFSHIPFTAVNFKILLCYFEDIYTLVFFFLRGSNIN